MIISPYLKRRLRTIEEAQAEAERLARLLADQASPEPDEARRAAPAERERAAARG